MKLKPKLPAPPTLAQRLRRPALLALLGALIVVLAATGMPAPESLRRLWRGTPEQVQRVHDDAEILPAGIRVKVEEYAQRILDESDVDVRFVTLRSHGRDDALEIEAPRLMRELDAGAEGGRHRGLLIVYDATTRRGRIEVGYGLEEYFPDGFVGYLLQKHLQPMFAEGDATQGIHFLLRILHHRLREAVLNQRFDPHVLEILQSDDPGAYLSGGAGASRTMPIAAARGVRSGRESVGKAMRKKLGPQPNPEAAYRAYLRWLADGKFDPTLELFTSETRKHLASMPMTEAYFAYILLLEYGQPYRITTRGDRALLVFTGSPLVCPHFFVQTPAGWQMDLIGEIRNTAEIGGGVYTWNYRGNDDPYTNRFADHLYKIGNYMRLIDGDNRQLPIRERAKDPSALPEKRRAAADS